MLRVAGLRGDGVGNAVDLFDLSHGEVHRLVCYCHYGLTVSAGTVATRLRALAREREASTWSPQRMVVGGVSAAAAVGLMLLAL